MSTLSPASQERFFSRLLLPFKVYVVIASVWLIYLASRAHVELGTMSGVILLVYAICIPFFVLAALVQFVAHWRRRGFTSLSFAFVAAILLVILWHPLVSSFAK